MTAAMHKRFGNHVPDILDCLAQLSSDEVPTPPKEARAMLDILPDEVWSIRNIDGSTQGANPACSCAKLPFDSLMDCPIGNRISPRGAITSTETCCSAVQ